MDTVALIKNQGAYEINNEQRANLFLFEMRRYTYYYHEVSSTVILVFFAGQLTILS